uniref:C2H2-type domain-containing protein n=2 Tax=Clastoptera arizonana TaxID=38151 RepID=A0A1B6DWN4_9HEMI
MLQTLPVLRIYKLLEKSASQKPPSSSPQALVSSRTMPRLRGRAKNIGRRTRNAQLIHDRRLKRLKQENSTDNVNFVRPCFCPPPDNLPHKCPNCPKRFPNEENLTSHLTKCKPDAAVILGENVELEKQLFDTWKFCLNRIVTRCTV